MCRNFIKLVGRLVFVNLLLFGSTASFAQTLPFLDWVTVNSTSNAASTDYEKGKGYSISLDAAGNVYAVGKFFGTVDFDPGAGVVNLTAAGDQDIFITKFDAAGNFLWVKGMGGTLRDNAYGLSIDLNGNLYMTGFFNGTADFDPGASVFNLTSAGATDIFICKLTNNGDFVWAKSVGNLYNSEGLSIATDASGYVYTTGFFTQQTDFNPGAGVFNLDFTSGSCSNCEQIFILKLDTNGNFVWAIRGGGFGENVGTGIAIDPSGNILTTGYFWSNAFGATANGTRDAFVAKHDSNGNALWGKSFGDTDDSSIEETGFAITSDASGNAYLTGRYKNTVDFDPGAGVFNITAVNSFDVFILKLNSSGNFVWAKSIGGTSTGVIHDAGYDIATDASGNVYTTGGFYGTVDFDPGAGVFNIDDEGLGDIFISKLDTDGNFIWAGSMSGCCGRDAGFSIAVNNTGNIYTTGYYSGGGTTNPADFDPNACTFDVMGPGGMFIQKLKIGTLPDPPTFTSFSPASGPIGATITLTGTNFSTTPASNAVKFFNNRTATATASTATSITVTVPVSSTSGKISVTANCVTVQSATDFIVEAPPTITSFTPSSGPVGTTVTITGTNFNSTPANNIVRFNGTTGVVSASTATSITTIVPAGATTGKITVTIAGNTATSTPNFTVTAPAGPTITSFTPSGSQVGGGVVITGTNFSTTPANNTVRFNGTTAIVSASTTTSITTMVPVNATTGKITVTVSGNTATSTNDFTVIVPPTNEPPEIESTISSVQVQGILTIDLTPLISDPDGNLDPTSIQLVSSVSEAGAQAELVIDEEEESDGDGGFITVYYYYLTLDYSGLTFTGTDHISLVACDESEACTEQELVIEVGSEDITVYNAISANGDTQNDRLIIQNIETFSKNKVSIFNRWGDSVFEMKNYNNDDRVFKGLGKNNQSLPAGTYYYKVEYSGKTKTGYLSLKR